MLVPLSKGTVAKLVSQTNPRGIEFCSFLFRLKNLAADRVNENQQLLHPLERTNNGMKSKTYPPKH